MPEDKLTLEQFGQKIKAKYPQYNDIDDILLSQKILAKYPQYSTQIMTEEGLMPTGERLGGIPLTTMGQVPIESQPQHQMRQ